LTHSASVLIDSVYLALWVVFQWLVGRLIEYLELSGVDKGTLVVFQYIFSVSTVAPILVFYVTDISKMVLRAWRAIVLVQREMDNRPFPIRH